LIISVPSFTVCANMVSGSLHPEEKEVLEASTYLRVQKEKSHKCVRQ